MQASCPGHPTAATEGPSIMVWDFVNAAPRVELTWPSGPARSVAYSPDGTTLATGDEEGSLRLWDAVSGMLRATLRGHTGAIDWVSFSPDGTTIATRLASWPSRAMSLPATRTRPDSPPRVDPPRWIERNRGCRGSPDFPGGRRR
jgi:WD40 repeat protein